jgi:poly(beta-D-mannuronate) lyase
MLKTILVVYLFMLSVASSAKTILVKNISELTSANKEAKPGDVIVLQNGDWHNVTIKLDCIGTKERPIIFKAQIANKVLITGNSKILIGGTFIVLDGLYFTNGFSGEDAVITFKINKNQIANNCRVTNIAINNFNNPKRLDENYWVALYGKNNRLDHSSFANKKNIGVLIAVILDDERSRENFHSIDHNYFGVRIPLASNGGEIIRVGVSQHCQFNSNTNIENNYFEHCDGETEIVSIKSCKNNIRNNIFKECQGSVVLRHGDYNNVENNIFLGNNKSGTGGVRIINKGQWVVNNFFYKCRGVGFRSPIAIMNGVVNSPPIRYVEVTDAVICNNSFYECSPMSFCIGSDSERTVVPKKIQFLNNLFYNSNDSLLYNVYDSINSITFAGNIVSKNIRQQVVNGFTKSYLGFQKIADLELPVSRNSLGIKIKDSLQEIIKERSQTKLLNIAGIFNNKKIKETITKLTTSAGAKWFNKNNFNIALLKKTTKVDCKSSIELIQILSKKDDGNLIVNLTGNAYVFNAPININQDVTITSKSKQPIRFTTSTSNTDFAIKIDAGNNLSLINLTLDISAINTNVFITTDTSGSASHSNFFMKNCRINNATKPFFHAAKSSVCDSIIVYNCSFNNGKANIFNLNEETDRKGYYNAELIKIINNTINNYNGQIITTLRSGSDESTMGPLFFFTNNKLNNCFTENNEALICNNGVQYSQMENNEFINCNSNKILIQFEDIVSAKHVFTKNVLENSGKIKSNKFTEISNNIIR